MRTSVDGSAGYVAIERVEGSLRGRKGGFTLLHQGTMRQGGESQLAIVIVPDSATRDLTGLAGRMTIVIADGRHSGRPRLHAPGSSLEARTRGGGAPAARPRRTRAR
ncbi:MAG: DUF3224 domain-containing protein [Vicinamibacteria bacterium]